MKLLEDHLRQLCDKPASGNLEPGFSHYFQPGISVMVTVAIVVLLIFWVGARSKSGGTILQDRNIFTGFIISASTFPHDVQCKILEKFPEQLREAVDPGSSGTLDSAAKALLAEKATPMNSRVGAYFWKLLHAVDSKMYQDADSSEAMERGVSLDQHPSGATALKSGSSLDSANGTPAEMAAWLLSNKYCVPHNIAKWILMEISNVSDEKTSELLTIIKKDSIPKGEQQPFPKPAEEQGPFPTSSKIRKTLNDLNNAEEAGLYDTFSIANEASVKPSDQEVSLIFATLHFIIFTYSAVDYLFMQSFPQGDLFFCKLPYVISVVAYKPVALPLWAVITTLCQSTFVECMFGSHPSGRCDPTGTCVASPISLNTWGLLLTQATLGVLGAWFIVVTFVLLPPVILLIPVLMIPFFILPFGAIFLPMKCTEFLTMRNTKEKKNDSDSDFDEVDAGDSDRRIMPNYDGVERLNLKLKITVFTLKCSAVQLLLLFVAAVPLVQIYTSEYSWSDGARDLIDLTMPDLKALQLQFQFSFQFPTFHLPRLQWQFVAALGLVMVEYVLKGGTVVHRWARLHRWFYVYPPKSNLSHIFAAMTWRPFRILMDLAKTALEGGVNSLYTDVLHARKRSAYHGEDEGPLFSGQEYYGRTMVYLCGITTCLMPIREGYRNPYTRVFSSKDEDSTVKAFCDSENALSYGAIACNDNPYITQIYDSLHSSVWLVRLSLFNCTNAKVDIKLLATRLSKLKHLELHTPGADVQMCHVTGDIKYLKLLLHLQTVRLSGTKVEGSIEVFNGMKELVVIEISFCTAISGNPIALSCD